MTRLTLSIAILVGISSTTLFAADTITLRENAKELKGTISSGSPDGLRISVPSQSTEVLQIPWSKIQSLQSSRPRPTLQSFLDQGEILWRGKSRLERGDVLLAQPLFEQAFDEMKDSTSYDARLAAEGLLRCALSRGDLQRAIEPWIVTARLTESGIETPFPDLLPILDESSFLCPYLPPVWIYDTQALQLLQRYTQLSLPKTSQNVKSIFAVANAEPADELQHVFMHQLFYPTSKERATELQEWQQIWKHYFHGIQLLQSTQPDSRQQGLLQLAIVSANGAESQPWLACAAMLRLSDELNIDGFQHSAIRIRDEALRLFPTHPLHQKDLYHIRNLSK